MTFRRLVCFALLSIPVIHPLNATADILVASYTGGAILRFDEVTGTPLAPLVNFGMIPGAAGMTFGPDGFLYVSSQATFQGAMSGNDAIVRVDPTTGAISNFITLPQAYSPAGIAFAQGRMYVSRFGVYGASTGNESVDRYQLNGTPDGVAITGLSNPSFLALDASGNNLYVSNFNGGTSGSIKRYNIPGTSTTDFIPASMGPNALQGPQGLGFSGGSLYVVDQIGEAVRRYDATTGAFQSNFISAGPLVNDFANDLLFDRQGQLLLTTLGPNFMVAQSDILRFNAVTGSEILPPIASNSNLAFSALAITPIPEPSSMILAGLGVGGYAIRRCRREKQQS